MPTMTCNQFFILALLQDFLWGKSVDYLKNDKITVVAWGFSYQGIYKGEYKCDFKFNSYTFNAGYAFEAGDFQLTIFKEDGQENTVGQRLEGYLKIAVNRFRADPYQNRVTKVSEIQKMMKENESRLDSPWNDLLKCKKDPQA